MEFYERSKQLKEVGLKWSTDRVFRREDEKLGIHHLMEAILGFMGLKEQNYQGPVYLGMYDIRSDKVRRLVAKYMERKGFQRIQKSVYLCRLPPKIYREVVSDLREMNELYENKDSFIFIPLNSDILGRSHFIGKDLDIKMIQNKPAALVL